MLAFADHMERQYGALVVVYMAYPTDGDAQCTMLVSPMRLQLHLIPNFHSGLRTTRSPSIRFKIVMNHDTKKL